jgi:hypothetical protein
VSGAGSCVSETRRREQIWKANNRKRKTKREPTPTTENPRPKT